MILVSACLFGVNCRYDGENSLSEQLREFLKNHDFVLACPEELGGKPTPREPNEIINATGKDVLEGKARIKSKKGEDSTEEFLKGAYKALEIAKKNKCEFAILKSKSPSCGYGRIYNGEFNGDKVKGNGVTAELLSQNGIKVFTEENLEEFFKEYEMHKS
ncbi:DUF523 domain-containing protein [Hathewaya histolytica]|uniref:DUF523 domain-containing protein n=1 Tax=Hathewaya histolytica TaxID=1498 RepID=UPI003B66E166